MVGRAKWLRGDERGVDKMGVGCLVVWSVPPKLKLANLAIVVKISRCAGV
jgi:hypothetical protein